MGRDTVVIGAEIVIILTLAVIEFGICKVEVFVLASHKPEYVIIVYIRNLDIVGHSDGVIVTVSDLLFNGYLNVGV